MGKWLQHHVAIRNAINGMEKSGTSKEEKRNCEGKPVMRFVPAVHCYGVYHSGN